LAPFCLRERW
jgi:hypothetical protein